MPICRRSIQLEDQVPIGLPMCVFTSAEVAAMIDLIRSRLNAHTISIPPCSLIHSQATKGSIHHQGQSTESEGNLATDDLVQFCSPSSFAAFPRPGLSLQYQRSRWYLSRHSQGCLVSRTHHIQRSAQFQAAARRSKRLVRLIRPLTFSRSLDHSPPLHLLPLHRPESG